MTVNLSDVMASMAQDYAAAVRQQLDDPEMMPGPIAQFLVGIQRPASAPAAPVEDWTVARLAEALAALPAELQDYEVWIESDPSMPVGPTVPSWIDHEGRRVFL